MKNFKRFLSLALAVLMIFSYAPTIAYANEQISLFENIEIVEPVEELEEVQNTEGATPTAENGWYWDGNTLYVYQGKITKGELYNALVAKYGSGTYKYGTSKPTLSWALGGTEVK